MDGKQHWILFCIHWQQTQESIFGTGALFSGLVVGFKVGLSERALKCWSSCLFQSGLMDFKMVYIPIKLRKQYR